MVRASKARWLPAALLLCAACDVTLPWRDGSTPDAPASFGAASSTFDSVYLTWSAQAGIDAWQLETRVGTGPWGPTAGYAAGPSVWYVPLADVPEATTCAFRLRSIAAGHASAWAATQVLHGPRPPASVAAQPAPGNGSMNAPITVRWTNTSAVATDVRVERTIRDNNADRPWIVLPGATLAAGALVDAGVEEGVAYTYRVRVGVGGVWSDAVEAWTDPVVFFAPTELSAEMATTGVRLTWRSRSAAATETSIVVFHEGESGVPEARLPGLPTSWVHGPLPVWPVARYLVAVGDGGYRFASSNVADLPPFRIAGPPGLAASAATLPLGSAVARDGDGRFHVVVPTAYDAFEVQRATATGPEAHACANVRGLFDPGIAVDATGNPHVVYERYGATAWITEVVHEAWNGTGWDAEVVGTIDAASYRSFALDPAGALHLVHVPQFATSPLVHLVHEGLTTTETILPPDPISSLAPVKFDLATGPDGTAVVARAGPRAGAGTDTIVVSTRTPGGAWSHDPAPVGTVVVVQLEVAAGSGGDVAIAWTDRSHFSVDGGDDVLVVRRTGGVWSAPERVVARPWSGSEGPFALAGSGDLAKLVLSVPVSGRTRLFVRGAGGWEGVEVGPSAPPAWVGVGPAGAWALYRNEFFYGAKPSRYSLFDEVP